MKTPARPFFLAALASWMALAVAALAQNNPATAAPPPAAPTAEQVAAAPAAPAEPATVDRTASESASEITASEAESAAPEATAEPKEASELRRLDQPTAPADATDAAATPEADEAAVEKDDSSAAAPAEAPAAPARESRAKRQWHGPEFNHSTGNERVSFWQDSALAENEEADAVVSIVGSSTSAGKVHDSVVSVLGSSTSSGDVANAVVSVFGSTRVTGGTVGDAVVSVLGNTYVNGRVRGEVVSVLGNIELGPQAEVFGEIVCVGGKVIRDPSAVSHGEVNSVQIGFSFGGFEWLHAWVSRCLLYGRPLAFGPHLMWAWWIAIGFLALYMILALVFPRGIERCAETLEQRPGYSILTAFLVTILAPAAAVLLAITVIGTPALVLAMWVGSLFGKAAMLAWIGRRITKLFGSGPLNHPFAAVAIGGVIVLMLYTVPVVGFVVAKLTSWLGVGVVVYTLILIMQRNKAARPVAVAAGPVVGVVSPDSSAADMNTAGFTGAALPAGATGGAVPMVPPVVISAATQMRAGFWIRLAASLIDAAIVAVTVNLFPDRWEPNFLLSFAVYCVVLWGTKATTIGGIICSLKVVRLDDRKLDWPTALVRTLGGFVSLIPAGLGFIWVAFDDQRQSWHDKIAGTTVVSVPRGVSLL